MSEPEHQPTDEKLEGLPAVPVGIGGRQASPFRAAFSRQDDPMRPANKAVMNSAEG